MALPDCSYVNIDDLTEPSGSSYTYCLLSEMRAIKARMQNMLLVGEFSDIYIPPGTGAVATTVQAKLRETVSVKDVGAKGDGLADDTTAFNTRFSESNCFVPGETYVLNGAVSPSEHDTHITIDPDAVFIGSTKPNFNNLIPYQITPVWASDIMFKTYGSGYSSYSTVFSQASYARATVDRRVDYKGAVVAVYGGADSAAEGAACWGGNFVAYAGKNHSTAISVEINFGVLESGGTAYGLVLASAGHFPTENAIQIQSNESTSQYKNGIVFNFTALTNLTSGAGILFNGVAAAGNTVTSFIKSANVRATTAEVDLPSFAVAGTKATPANRVLVTGAETGLGPSISATGPDTNISLALFGKGTGEVNIASGNLDSRIKAGNTGLGFNGSVQIAKPNIGGSTGGNAALQNLLVALEAYGLITDSTT